MASPLNGEWVRVDADLELPPQFVKREAPDIAMFYTGCAWRICRGAGVVSAGEILAEAPSAAARQPPPVVTLPIKIAP